MKKHTWTAAKIKALRKRLGLTRIEFAVRLGMGYSTLCNWEQKKAVPDRRHAAALDALDSERAAQEA